MPILTASGITVRVDSILKVGTVSLPSNTTAGDLTATRVHIGTDGAFTSGYGFELTATRMLLSGTISDANAVGLGVTPTLSSNTGTLQAIQVAPIFNGAAPTATYALVVQPSFLPASGTLAAAGAVLCIATAGPPVGVTITSLYGAFFRTDYNNVAGAVTAGYAFFAAPPTISGSLKPTTQYGVYVSNQGATGITTAVGINIDLPTNAGTNKYMSFNTANITAPATGFTGWIDVLVAGVARKIPYL